MMRKLMLVVLPLLVVLGCNQNTNKGLGARATGHSVTLTFAASTSTGVTGYNAYRGTTSGGESATALNSSPFTGTTYVDSGVAALTTYYYTVKAYCPTCSPTLSVASNEVQASVPGDVAPLPPTNVTATAQ